MVMMIMMMNMMMIKMVIMIMQLVMQVGFKFHDWDFFYNGRQAAALSQWALMIIPVISLNYDDNDDDYDG